MSNPASAVRFSESRAGRESHQCSPRGSCRQQGYTAIREGCNKSPSYTSADTSPRISAQRCVVQHRPPQTEKGVGHQSDGKSVVEHRITSRSLTHWITAPVHHSNHNTAQPLAPLFARAAAEYRLACTQQKTFTQASGYLQTDLSCLGWKSHSHCQ